MFLISTQLFQEMRKQVLLTIHEVPVLHLGITPSCKTYKNATSIEQIYFKICFSLAAVIMKWNLKDGVPQAHWALCFVCGGRNVHMLTKWHFSEVSWRAASARTWCSGLETREMSSDLWAGWALICVGTGWQGQGVGLRFHGIKTNLSQLWMLIKTNLKERPHWSSSCH